MRFRYEIKKISQGFSHIIGCDEVGRGCLAGPVVAAAVILKPSIKYKVLGIRDSKLLSAEKREELAPIIKENAIAWSIAEVSSQEIDRINIHNASLLAMKKAVEKLMLSFFGVILEPEVASEGEESQEEEILRRSAPQDDANKVFLAIDGKFKLPNLNLEQEAIIDGDNKILSIAAASIIAKVYRDGLMKQLHEKYPVYNLAQHKGYATKFHRIMILQNGLSAIHRLSFCGNFAKIK